MESIINKKINVLMREYELHRQEILLQIELYNRQTKYIQIFGAFLLALMAFLSGIRSERVISWIGKEQIFTERSGQMSQISYLSPFIILMFLILASVIIFYLVATIMAASYMFLILRKRMALIESKVNDLLQSPGLLEYETRITPHFLEDLSYANYHLTPHLLSGIWRVFIYMSVIFILCWISLRLLPPPMAWSYCIGIAIVAIMQIFHYAVINRKIGKDTIEVFISDPKALRKKVRVRYIVILIIAFLILVLTPIFISVFNV